MIDCFVSQGTGTGNNTDLTFGVNIAWHDTNLAFARLDDTWAVRSNEASLALRLHNRFDLDHVESRNALCDADNKIHFSFDGFQNGISCERRRNVNNRSFGVSSSLSLSDRAENGKAEMLSSSLAFVYTTNNLGSIGKSLFGMESSLDTTKCK